MATVAPPSHIHLDEQGRAWIDDTNTKVVEVVLDKLANDSSAEEMHRQLPHLSMAQIHAALAFYYDNKPSIDAEIERARLQVEAMRASATGQVTREQLLRRAEGTGAAG